MLLIDELGLIDGYIDYLAECHHGSMVTVIARGVPQEKLLLRALSYSR